MNIMAVGNASTEDTLRDASNLISFKQSRIFLDVNNNSQLLGKKCQWISWTGFLVMYCAEHVPSVAT